MSARRLLLIWALLLAGIVYLAQQPTKAYWQSRDSNYNVAISTGATYTGPGDVVSGAAGWWGLRGYSAAYSTGSNPAADICDVATGTTCTTINVLSSGRFDAATAAASSSCASSCNISKLYDQSGNGHHATQATNATRPLLAFNCIGTTLPCFTMSGSQFLAINTTSIGNVSQPWTVSCVGWRTSGGLSSLYGDGSGNGYGILYSSGANSVGTWAGAQLTQAATDGAFHAIQAIGNGASNSVIYVDGSGTTGNASTNQLTGVGSQIGNGFSTLTGKATECGAWGSAFSGANQSAMNANQHGSNGWNF